MLGMLVPFVLASVALTLLAKPLGLVPLLVALLVLHRMTQLGHRLGRAVVAHDLEEAARLRRLIDGEGPPRNRVEKNVRMLGEAEALLAVEKWAEARDLFATIDIDALVALAQPGVVSELGYATAHAGQPAEGVEHLLRAVAMAEAVPSYPRGKRWFVDQRLGVALSLAGRHDEAIAVLDDVTSNGLGEPRPWTEALYFLARSLGAMGETEGSSEVMAVASSEGEGPFAARARAALALALGAPHRAGGPAPEPADEPDDAQQREEGAGARRASRR